MEDLRIRVNGRKSYGMLCQNYLTSPFVWRVGAFGTSTARQFGHPTSASGIYAK